MKLQEVTLGVLLATAAVAQSPDRALRDSKNDSLARLASATSLEQLRTAFQSAPHNFAHQAVYAAQYYKLGGRNADSLLLRSLPRDGKQMKHLYEAQDTREGQDMAVTEAYNTFYEASADAVVKHPLYLPHFLRMIHSFNYEDNVDEWPWLCGLASKIYSRVPQQYMTAVGKLERAYRKDALNCREGPDAP
jgi:hypothetical protein